MELGKLESVHLGVNSYVRFYGNSDLSLMILDKETFEQFSASCQRLHAQGWSPRNIGIAVAQIVTERAEATEKQTAIREMSKE